MHSHFEFHLFMQNVEVSQIGNVDINTCKLLVIMKKGAAQQQILLLPLSTTNTICVQNYYKVDVMHKVDISQMLVEKEKGAGFGDYNVKFLFYLQSPKSKLSLGQITINLSFYPNASIEHIQEKKFMQSTTDKRAALYFELDVIGGENNYDNDILNSDVLVHDLNYTPQQRNQSIDRPIRSALNSSLLDSGDNSQKKLMGNKVSRNSIKIGQTASTRQFQEDPERTKSRQTIQSISTIQTPQVTKTVPRGSQRVRSPTQIASTARLASKSQDRVQMVSALANRKNDNIKSPKQMRPRALSPQPQPMPNKLPYATEQKPQDQQCELTQKFQSLSDKFSMDQEYYQAQQQKQQEQDKQKQQEQDKLNQMQELIQRQEEELEDQLNQIDRKIETIRTDPQRVEQPMKQKNSSERSPLELEMQKTINLLREENEKIRDQMAPQINPDLDKLKNIIKEMSSRMNLRNSEIDRQRKLNSDLQEENQQIRSKQSKTEQEVDENNQLIQKLRIELDSQTSQCKKTQSENQALLRKIDELSRQLSGTPQTPKQLSSQSVSRSETELRKENQMLQDSLSEAQQKCRLLGQQNEHLGKALQEMQIDQKYREMSHMPQELMKVNETDYEITQELESMTYERDQLKDQVNFYNKQCENYKEVLEGVQRESAEKDYGMTELETEIVRIKQQLGECLNAAFEMGGADLVDLIEQKIYAIR